MNEALSVLSEHIMYPLQMSFLGPCRWARTMPSRGLRSTPYLAWQRSEPPHRSGADPFRLSPTVGWALSLEAS